jgi:hypothetical protein
VDGIQRFNRHIFLNKLFGPIQDRRTDFHQLPSYNHSAIRIFESIAARPAPPSTEPISAYSAERSILITLRHEHARLALTAWHNWQVCLSLGEIGKQ